MKKFLISEEEKNNILSMHKALIKEQVQVATTSSLDILRKAIKGGCLRNGQLVQSKVDPSKYIYRAKTDNGTDIDFFGDMTYKLRADGKTGKWKLCPGALQLDTNAAATAATAAANAADTTLLQQEGGWKKREDITDTNANVNNLQMYQRKEVNGVTLYRRVSGAGIAGGLDTRQQGVITKWQAQGAKLEKELDAEQSQTWTKKLVSPKSDGLFSEDFYMYFPPNTVNNAAITTAFQAAYNDQTPKSKSDCKQSIEMYYMAFKTKAKMEPNQIESMKEKVQACVNQFDGKWGVGAFTKIDDYVDILRGRKPGGPSTYGDSSKWKLK